MGQRGDFFDKEGLKNTKLVRKKLLKKSLKSHYENHCNLESIMIQKLL